MGEETKMKFRLIKLWKEGVGGKSVLVWELKDPEGKKHTFRSATLQPRFYVPENQMVYDDERVVGVESIPQTHILTGEKMKRVYTDVTRSVGALRKSTYRVEGEPSIASQADILFPEVALIESDIYDGVEIADNLTNMDSLPFEEFKPCEAPDVPYVVNYLDIECQHPPNVLPDIKREKDIIYQIGTFQEGVLKYFWVDNNHPIPTKEEVLAFCENHGLPPLEEYDPANVQVYPDEQQMLIGFIECFESLDPDVLTGWNITFDIDYIMGRCKRYRLGTRWWHCIRKLSIHDTMEAYKRLYRAPSNRFKDVIVHENVTENVVEDEHDVKWWREGENDICFVYNGFDVVWLEALDIKKSIIEHDWGVKEMAGFPDLTPTNWRMPIVDIVALRVARDEFILPSKMEWDDIRGKGEKKKGAIVFQPKLGATFGVAILDFSMYYPYIIIAHNLSKEIPAGQLTPKGLIPRVCEYLIQHRLAAKAAEAEALDKYGPESEEKKKAKRLNDVSKFMLNSVFGVTGNPSFRLYEKRVFESITGFGREGLILIKQMAEERGFEVVYGDTDSLFIKFDNYEQASVFTEDLNKALNAIYKEQYGLTVNFDIKVEKWLSPVVFSKKRDKDEAGKKRYFYRVVIEDGIDLESRGQDYVVIMGHAMVRRDASPLCKFVQKKVFEDIAYGRMDEIEPFLEDCWKKYTAGEFELDAVAARMTLHRKFEDYKQPPIASRGAKFLNEHMNPSVPIEAGDTVRYVYVKSVDGRRSTNIVAYNVEADVVGRIEVDWDLMFEKQIIAKTEDVLEDVDIYWEQIMGQTDLLSLF
jgi:DNA polymerase elongation subunit (family B)